MAELDPKRIDAEDEKALRDHTKSPNTQLLLYTSDGHSFSLQDWCHNRHVFLLCGGPSLKANDLSQLRERAGIVTFAVNNVWTVYRPNFWICVDRPGNFVDTGWKDPSIIKFAPMAHVDKKLHVKKKGGGFTESNYSCRQMPSVFYFKRNERFDPKTFFTENTVNWGNHGNETDSIGVKGSRSVMLAAMRMMVYLGFKHIYILGADFTMTAGNEAHNYSWKQGRSQSSISGNNATYAALNKRFDSLRPALKKLKVEVWNCCESSGLASFPFKPYSEAVDKATRECSKKVDTEGWYSHGNALK